MFVTHLVICLVLPFSARSVAILSSFQHCIVTIIDTVLITSCYIIDSALTKLVLNASTLSNFSERDQAIPFVMYLRRKLFYIASHLWSYLTPVFRQQINTNFKGKDLTGNPQYSHELIFLCSACHSIDCTSPN